MKKILIINPHYLPGYKSGGPQQTVQNICEVFGSCSEIFLVTLNFDFGETALFDLETNKWLQMYGIHIMYVPLADYNFKLFRRLYEEFDTILACGLFCSSTIQIMFIHRFYHALTRYKELYVAPMGVFSKNALAIKRMKKKAFLTVLSQIGIFKHIIWSFTSQDELSEAEVSIGIRNIKRHIIAEDLPRYVDFNMRRDQLKGKGDILKVIFLSRIVPKKNLLYAIEILDHVFEGRIQFDIYGPIEDRIYWEQCNDAIKGLPSDISCHYCGSVKPDESLEVFAAYDLFLFPTKGENFGHVIYESLASGCVPLISDTTPWKDFKQEKCGSVVALEDIETFRDELRLFLRCSENDFLQYKMNAVNYAEKKYRASIENSGYRIIFETAKSYVCGGGMKQNPHFITGAVICWQHRGKWL